MKKIISLLYVFTLISALGAQNIKETKITVIPPSQASSLYDFKYDKNSGSFAYSIYDTILNKSTLISNKGNSTSYNSTDTYNLFFDDKGNYYTYASVNITDTTFKYFFIKNGKEVKSFDNLVFPIQKRDDGIYFIASENGKDYRVKFDFVKQNFEYSKGYDTIYTCFMDIENTYEEPDYKIGFTKDGKDFFIASNGGKQMLVLGNRELKQYDEILYRAVLLDPSGKIYYVGKEISGNSNNLYLVHGEKEYGKFTDINSYNVAFDKDNIPYYSASDEQGEYPSAQFLVKGNAPISKKFNRGIGEIKILPNGNIAYTGTDSLPDGTSVTSLIINGKESAKYPSIFNVKFRQDNTCAFIVTDINNKSFVVDNNKTVSDMYSYIMNLDISKNGVLTYIATNSGDYDKNIPDDTYYVIGKDKFGPVNNQYSERSGPPPVVFNESGDYVFPASKDIMVKGESRTKSYLKHKKWTSELYDFISDINSYDNDFYYTGVNYQDNGVNINQLYKNSKKLSDEYVIMNNYKFEKVSGTITFTGMRKNTIYFVEITL